MEMEDTLPDIDGSQICVSPLQSQTEEIAIKEIRSRRVSDIYNIIILHQCHF